MEVLCELTNALSNGTIPDPLRPPLSQNWGFATPKTSIAIISGTGKATSFKFCTHVHFIGTIGTKAESP